MPHRSHLLLLALSSLLLALHPFCWELFPHRKCITRDIPFRAGNAVSGETPSERGGLSAPAVQAWGPEEPHSVR